MFTGLLLHALAAQASDCDRAIETVDAAILAGGPCFTPALLAFRDGDDAICAEQALSAYNLTPPRRLVRPRGEPPPGPKTVREAITDDVKVYETANFAIKWGGGVADDDPSILALAEAFEVAWVEEVDGLGFGPPAGSDHFKFNVYIGDSGGGTPDGAGAAGYYNVDRDGYGYIVIAKDGLLHPQYTATTAAHEFFHALQDTVGTYDYDPEGQGAWYWEAGAMWVEHVVYPDDPSYAMFLMGLAYLPDLPVNFFKYPDGTLEGYHQYGAFLFLQHLTEITVGNDELIRRSWTEAPPSGDALLVLDGLLQEGGHGTIEQAYVDYSGRLGTFDWADAATYEANLDDQGGWAYPGSRRPSDTIYAAHDVPLVPPRAPSTFGSNYWLLRGVPDPVEVHFRGDAGVAWHVQLAVQDGGTHTRTPIPVDPTDGSAVFTGLTGADEAWIVVSAVQTTVDDGALYGYELRLVDPELVTDTDTDTDTDTGEAPRAACGCDGTSGGGWLGLLVFGALRRRRTANRLSGG